MALPGPHTTLSDNEFRDAIWHRLGLSAPVGRTDCALSPADDPLGYHRLGCKSSAAARLRRHNALASIIANFALKADPRAFQVAKEIGLEDDSRARPGDVSINLGDVCTLLDVTVANPYTAARIRASRNACSPAVAAEEAFDRKTRKYSDLFSSAIDETCPPFVPLAVTASGAWDGFLETLENFLKLIENVEKFGKSLEFCAKLINL